ncbi:MAG: Hpt domain-containing protein, partial [Thalassolituus sp.]
MSFDADEEILQDFLVEAGEILELLSEQLVDLEQRPDDNDLLNAIFRGFHTVKGGAGFLQLAPLVDCCHAAENVFVSLRIGKRTVTSELMDVVLSALDTVNEISLWESQRADWFEIEQGRDSGGDPIGRVLLTNALTIRIRLDTLSRFRTLCTKLRSNTLTLATHTLIDGVTDRVF